MPRSLPTLWLPLLLPAVAACSQPASPGMDPPPSTTGSERAGFDLIRVLESRASVEILDSFPSPPFGVPATALRVDERIIQVYEYATEGAARVEAARFSADATKFDGPDGATSITWVAPPHLHRRDRWIAAYQGSDPELLRLLADVMGPQFAGARP